MKRIQIERKSKVLPADIAREHLQGVGKPVIITDATENWPARSKWTFEFFKTAYGSDLAIAWLRAREWYWKGDDLIRLHRLSRRALGRVAWRLDRQGYRQGWSPTAGCAWTGASPFYLLGWYAFRQHPELYDDIAPAPYFVQDLVSALNPTLRDVFEWTSNREYTAIFIGPEGSLSALHRDLLEHAWLSGPNSEVENVPSSFRPKIRIFCTAGKSTQNNRISSDFPSSIARRPMNASSNQATRC